MPKGPEKDAAGRLLTRTAAGDMGAFTEIYDLFADAVMGLSCRILHDAAQAEEVTQDVMVEVWRTADRFRPERGSARSWILTLTHRRAVDRVRSAQASSERERLAGMLVRDRAFDEVAETVADRDEHRRVYHCLAALARLQRVPLVLAYYQGMTYVEVADSLALPQGTVKSRMRAGLRRLRECMETDP
ncbi:ECF RNA polymerase sigma factor SigK [Streptomyces sp. NPDC003717]|uniref:ECF RNA polymerase sigma factor SigK n=1 Tax=Streptomyces sp. NPDC003717 TaxID=3154276 RepID=UPI0033B10E11